MNSNVLNEHMEKIYRVYPRYITLVNTQHERLHVHCMTQEHKDGKSQKKSETRHDTMYAIIRRTYSIYTPQNRTSRKSRLNQNIDREELYHGDYSVCNIFDFTSSTI